MFDLRHSTLVISGFHRAMLIWLMHRFAPLWERLEFLSTGDSRVFLTARIALASVTSFLMAMLLGPAAIHWLKRRFPERIDSASEQLNALQSAKQKTPTMGGLFVVSALVCAVLLWGDLSSPYVLLGLYTAVSFAALGALDDWIKLSTPRNGLRVRTKLLVQLLLALAGCGALYVLHRDVPRGVELIWPFGDAGIPLRGGFVVWGVLVMAGSSNAVNLTDGLDGLAGGCTIFAGSAFVALCYLSGHAIMAQYLSIPFIPGSGELAVVLGALVGAMMGFLWFNCYPAQVFLGDTGALMIGALLGLAALVTRQEVLLIVIGGVFVIETMSVILQVAAYRLTGRRLIACSPLHNHFLFRGEHEMKIVVRFWIGSAVLAIIAVASLKIH